jgi:hypothetical protein
VPPIVPIISQTKKNDRLMQMGPVFRIGKVRIRKTHARFIDQWVSFDHEVKNNDDDLLDAVEIALSGRACCSRWIRSRQHSTDTRGSLEEEAYLQILRNKNKKDVYDPELGSEAKEGVRRLPVAVTSLHLDAHLQKKVGLLGTRRRFYGDPVRAPTSPRRIYTSCFVSHVRPSTLFRSLPAS